MLKRISLSQQFFLLPALFIGQLMLIGSVDLVTAGSSQERRFPQAEVALEIVLPNSSRSPLRLQVSNGVHAATLINRKQLTISDSKLAGDFTAIDIWAEGEGNTVRVRLSVIYNDVSNQEWWKDKKEKVAGSLLIREGESAHLPELEQFGIEPFEMRVIDARPVVIQPGEGPPINNKTKSLEVVRLEKSLNGYEIWLRNNSSKNVVAYTISIGDGKTTNGVSHRSLHSNFAPGATSDEIRLFRTNEGKDEITIPLVVFDDGTFEGDVKLAAVFQMNEEGIRIQAPHVLRMVEQALEAEDDKLQTAFEKLEADLWVIPEAIDKPSALELLKSKYPSFDDKTISSLYEELKGGLYQARNRALSPIGDVKRRIQEDEQRQGSRDVTSRVTSLRMTLMRIKSDLEEILRFKR